MTQIRLLLQQSIKDNQEILLHGLDKIVSAIKETRPVSPPPPPGSPLIDDDPPPFTQTRETPPDDSDLTNTESDDSLTPLPRRSKTIKNRRSESESSPEINKRKKSKAEGAPTPPQGICMNIRDKAYMVKYRKSDGSKTNKNFSKKKYGSYDDALAAAIKWRREYLG